MEKSHSVIWHLVELDWLIFLGFWILPSFDIKIHAFDQKQHEKTDNSFENALDNIQGFRVKGAAYDIFFSHIFTVKFLLSDVHVIGHKTVHDGSTNNVHDDTEEKVEDDCIAKYFNVSYVEKEST